MSASGPQPGDEAPGREAPGGESGGAPRDQFHFHPDTYLDLMRAEVPAYELLQEVVADTTGGAGGGADRLRILDLGTGTGETARRVLARHPDAALVGIDESDAMLGRARTVLPDADLRVGRLEDELPAGPFDLAVSALAVHHLDGPGKADLFGRVHAVLAPGGRFVLGDVVVPEDPADQVTPIDGVHDRPSTVADQLTWLTVAGFETEVVWRDRDLAVIAALRPG